MQLRQTGESIAAPVAAPTGQPLAADDYCCHSSLELRRVILAWPQLSGQARRMILAAIDAADMK